jgi:hypothetical protein
MENQSIYEDKALLNAFEEFVLENESSVPLMMDAIGKNGVYLVFVSGYLSGLNHVGSILDNEFLKIKSII